METTTDGSSFFKRNKEKVRQRKLKRGKRREDRRKYGWNKKRRAENKAEAETKRKALAQAAIVGGDHQAGAKDTGGGDYKFSNDIATATIDAGGSMKKSTNDGSSLSSRGISNMNKKAKAIGKRAKAKKAAKAAAKAAKMKTNQDGGGYAAKDSAAPAKEIKANQNDGGAMMKRHRFSRNSSHGTSMYKKHGASMNAYQDKKASMDDYSHEKKLKADGRYEAAHGKMANARNDFDHAHALKKDAHHDTKGRHSILKHMRKF